MQRDRQSVLASDPDRSQFFCGSGKDDLTKEDDCAIPGLNRSLAEAAVALKSRNRLTS
jgi:hypothetical protein